MTTFVWQEVAGGCRWSGQLDSAYACPQVQICLRGLLPWPLYPPELTHVAGGLPSSAFPAVVVVLTPPSSACAAVGVFAICP